MAIACLLSPRLLSFLVLSSFLLYRAGVRNLLAEECRRIDESKWQYLSLVIELVSRA
jgi:hypothetical protein